MAPTDHVDFTHYTLDGYRAIVKWKTAFYSFYLPVALAMYMVSETLLHEIIMSKESRFKNISGTVLSHICVSHDFFRRTKYLHARNRLNAYFYQFQHFH